MLDIIVGIALDSPVGIALGATGVVAALAAVDAAPIYIAGGDVREGAVAAVQFTAAAIRPYAAFTVQALASIGRALALAAPVAGGAIGEGAGAAGYHAQAAVMPYAALLAQFGAGLGNAGLAGRGGGNAGLGRPALLVGDIGAIIVLRAGLIVASLEAVVAVNDEDAAVVGAAAFIAGHAGTAVDVILGKADE